LRIILQFFVSAINPEGVEKNLKTEKWGKSIDVQAKTPGWGVIVLTYFIVIN